VPVTNSDHPLIKGPKAQIQASRENGWSRPQSDVYRMRLAAMQNEP
jgi:hypothetical protein